MATAMATQPNDRLKLLGLSEVETVAEDTPRSNEDHRSLDLIRASHLLLKTVI